MTKRLVVCCDGTWNFADQATAGRPAPTNVTKIALSVAPEDPAGVEQRVYYHCGVGTTRWERLRGGAFGFGLARNVLDAYRFVIDDYAAGDDLFLFGFSRGAYTARSLAGLIRNCGVLRRENADRVQEAWELYRNAAEKPSGVASALFRRAYSYDPRIRFLGMFDTVGALGVPAMGPRWLRPLAERLNRRREFHDTRLSSRVDGAFQALAIDERREVFEPALWHQKPGADGQEMKQVWFSGAHCDVGGGCPDASLSDIALLWMADRARAYGLGFRPGAFGPDGPADMAPSESTLFRVAPDMMARPHDSLTRFYRLMPAVDRPIGKCADSRSHRLDGNEYVASTAKEHFERDVTYSPPQLAEYLSLNGRLEPAVGALDGAARRPCKAAREAKARR
ncbi:DUF2235 domain-containing protein [Actinomadura sp. LD22]|uniref:DUF2235 domain-containing protein n=1 Tax=Actinomadura physcomitrii TaxID=2650748 RepID=A0A6I4MHQ7_9ACTN|nr:DUF2235 domain-containing protein [Actinomadura physcomitrii]MWA05322.1 DUF2235 domain-containing protein [Actinomadura physcomitrii]